MISAICRALLLTGAIAVTPLHAQWRFEAWLGDAWNAGTPVTFHQDGQPDLTIASPVWTTRPYAPTWYYSARIARWSGTTAWSFHFMHHKVYLENPAPPEVESFRITNGINSFLAERLWEVRGFDLGIGAGPVIAVPISTIRGKAHGGARGTFQSQYEFGGATVMLSLSRRFDLIPELGGTLAIKGTASTLDVSIANGTADLKNYALHLQYGLSIGGRRSR